MINDSFSTRPTYFTLFLCIVFLLFADAISAQTKINPVYVNGRKNYFDPALRGTWKSIGYGKIIHISDSTFQIYHTTNDICYKDNEELSTDFTDHYTHFIRNKNKLYFYISRGHNTANIEYEFERLKALPHHCILDFNAVKYQNPEFIFNLFWNTFNEHYAFFQERKINWQNVYNKYKPLIDSTTTDKELFSIFSAIIEPLHDSHINLLYADTLFKVGQPNNIKFLKESFKNQTAIASLNGYLGNWYNKQLELVSKEFLKKNGKKAANNKIEFGELALDIGYISFSMMTGFGNETSTKSEQLQILGEELDKILDAFENKKAIVIDVSLNQGGFDQAGLLIASRFADRRRMVYSKYPKGKSPTKAQKIFASPDGKKQFTKPVYVLTSNITVSGAETFVLAMKAFPHVKLIGENTRGALSDMLNKPLPKSFHITLSNERYLSPSGVCYEATGITPDYEVKVFPAENLDFGRKEALLNIINIISQ